MQEEISSSDDDKPPADTSGDFTNQNLDEEVVVPISAKPFLFGSGDWLFNFNLTFLYLNH